LSGPNLQDYPWRHRYSWEVGNPVDEFYVPALSRSVFYQRKAGFFSSTVLTVAAQGVARLVENGGRMQLLVGCLLSKEDVRAIKKGYDMKERVKEQMLKRFTLPVDQIMQDRLAVLAYMIANGTLEIKVAIPVDGEGQVVPADDEDGIFHEKVGIFTDALGNKLAFSGSVNETAQGWLKNRESFHVFRTWDQDSGHLRDEEEEFKLLWQNAGRFTLVIDFPQALREKLLNYFPTSKPSRDLLEKVAEKPQIIGPLWQFIKDAPYMINGPALAEAFCTVNPWPHQRQVINRVFDQYTGRFLLADEVGLGKTIEAGLVIKKLLLCGLVKRCLILAPKSVLRQWQEELREKFNLHVPRYEYQTFWGFDDREQPVVTENPWDGVQVALVSSQLVKREERRQELLAAEPWDMVILDEAHNARRSVISNKYSDRNKLLQLMDQLEKKTKGLLLLTGTPMQLDPVELWDLLVMLGMGGRWGAHAEDFKKYFLELRRLPETSDVNFLIQMLKDCQRFAASDFDLFNLPGSEKIGLITLRKLERLFSNSEPQKEYKVLGSKDKECLKQVLTHKTPIKRFMFRNTRNLLRLYQKRGWLDQNVPYRKVKDEFIDLDPVDECPLYERIEEYISKYYKKALEEKRSGLGFIMTIYRRRLTSSFYAITKSLERRLAFLKGDTTGAEDWLDEIEDISEDELQELTEEARKRLLEENAGVDEEIDYLDNFLRDLYSCERDSKYVKLDNDLREYLKHHSKMIIFTQYTDTMDYLRSQLQTYRNRLACYSGRGGEYWEGGKWQLTTKEAIKDKFTSGEYKILLCTDAASEGLNLQTCGLLINYDMPWNPMRVEQRIGRIDRIGQVFETVEILNYFYSGTVEETIYTRLSDRIGWFNQVVGELQPILSLGSLAAQIPSAIKKAAMSGAAEKEKVLKEVVAELLEEAEKAKENQIDLDSFAEELDFVPIFKRPPVMPQELQSIFTQSSVPGGAILEQDIEKEVYILKFKDNRYRVTFNPQVYDKKPDSVKLMAYGEPIFDEILGNVAMAQDNYAPVIRLASEQEPMMVGYFYRNEDGQWQEIITVTQFQEQLAKSCNVQVTEEELAKLRNKLLSERLKANEYVESLQEKRRQERLAAVRVKALRILQKLLCIEAVRLDTRNIKKLLLPKLKRGDIHFVPLFKIAQVPLLDIEINVDEVIRYKNAKPETLAGHMRAFYSEADTIAMEYKELWEM